MYMKNFFTYTHTHTHTHTRARARARARTGCVKFKCQKLRKRDRSLWIKKKVEILCREIEAVMNQISPDQCVLATTRAVGTRCNVCIAARGQHFE